MNKSVSYACDEDGIYENARATPLATCTMNAQSVALPKTYPHFASCGAISFAGERGPLIPSRSSSHFQIVLNILITAWWKSVRSPVSFALRHLLPARRSEIAEAAADRPRRCPHYKKSRHDTGT